ncbi:hypothetical protein [Streptomyces halobius]|uniref:Uncharacterized protein n=1 Tax=Streptomyces halobius TaxID=2879846 RepID=A0ABY4LYS0_9ACTN|nr:hypothetical protein [Streptomyces halobius]UQA90642.1 hypothetical protein K9S39_00855 [Streptomyces halobius]
MDALIRAALLEALADGRPIPPDALLPRSVAVEHGRLEISYGRIGALRKQHNGFYQIVLSPDDVHHVDVEFHPTEAHFPMTSWTVWAEGYAFARCAVRGTITPPGVERSAVAGSGVYERAVTDRRSQTHIGRGPSDMGWSRLVVQLDSGWETVVRHVEHSDMIPSGGGTADRCGCRAPRARRPMSRWG